jgi:hypothetical protein
MNPFFSRAAILYKVVELVDLQGPTLFAAAWYSVPQRVEKRTEFPSKIVLWQWMAFLNFESAKRGYIFAKTSH